MAVFGATLFAELSRKSWSRVIYISATPGMCKEVEVWALGARPSLVPLPRTAAVSSPKHPPASEPMEASEGCFNHTWPADRALSVALKYPIT